MWVINMYRKKRRSRGRGTKRKSRKRSLAAHKAWDTRIRNEGKRQIAKTLIGAINPINKIRTAKNLAIGIIKIAKPRTYRKTKILKKLDKPL